MTENAKRIGLAASILGGVAAIVYLVRGKEIGPAGPPGPGGQSYPLPITPGFAGIPIAPGPAGGMGTPGTPEAADAPVNAPVTDNAGAGSPSISNIYNTYNQGFGGIPSGDAPDAPAIGFYSAQAPFSSFPKAMMGATPIQAPTDDGGCASGGCKGTKACPNAGGPLQFTDGGGACAATSLTSLQDSMDACQPGNLQRNIANFASGFIDVNPNDTFDANKLYAAITQMQESMPPVIPAEQPIGVPTLRFGLL